ncbi:ExbD/TolR family protein [Thermochromatium tepidum]|uniref:Biopolymer transporter ExbD n=1 Tax=Thermochromatium tepidum ATCC 43061 TaxID=316276 RepID=A0A6I6EAB8_THETI|nr:biopolymer transporter ExbD [Thermochromatium tepidum]QGU32236.1 biopolymer transporter ExbD [Thermochromatium tepidum ATCC 43061]
MKFIQPHRRSPGDTGLIPLINVILLMLIFFMLMGRLTPPEPLNVTPPTANTGRAPTEAPILLLIDAEGRMALDARPIEADALMGRIAALADPASQPVTIKADARLNVGSLRAVLTLLRQAGIARVDLMTVGRP